MKRLAIGVLYWAICYVVICDDVVYRWRIVMMVVVTVSVQLKMLIGDTS